MLSDIVIDTNVLVHAGNPNDKFFADSMCLIVKMIDNSVPICIDDNIGESLIVHEYLDNLHHGSLGRILIENASQNLRFKPLPCRTDPSTHKFIKKNISSKRDKTFLRVAFNSDEKTLVSHDFKHFHKNIRKLIKQMIKVEVIIAPVCISLL